MTKYLAFLSLFCIVLTACAELNVEWIDENTIVVTGYGYGNETNETALGSCTNCLAISPAEMHSIKVQILDKLGEASGKCDDILSLLSDISNTCYTNLEDISTFRRFSTGNSTPTASQRSSFTNYINTVDNSQTRLDRSYSGSANPYISSVNTIRYNDGIYDYANEYVAPSLSSILATCPQIYQDAEDVKSTLTTVSNIVRSITEESCSSCGGTDGNSCSDCPCKEQWETLLDYIKHIDDDQHDRYKQLNAISNDVYNINERFDSYAELVSGILYNDATIVVDDGENSWSNVYRRGSSDLYDYNKSNILQRIELLLFGITYNTSTNWGDVSSDISQDIEDTQQLFDDTVDLVSEGKERLETDIKDLKEEILSFFRALNFFGSGSFGEFALTDPFTVFDTYTFEIDSGGNVGDLADLQRMSRIAFQIVYWSAGVVFMIWFWFSFIRFVSTYIIAVIKFFNHLLT